MLTQAAIAKLIFGLKIQQLRQEAALSYHQLSDKSSLAVSYLHSIEKGKKYPKADKIHALAKALNSDYDYLVSLEEPNKKLRPIIELLKSDFMQVFPLDTFGISTTKLLELLIHAPEKVNAFISTVVKITRNFNMQGEDFYKAALRSYQNLYDNYFESIEAAVGAFRQGAGVDQVAFLSVQDLERLLQSQFGIWVDRSYLNSDDNLKQLRSVYVPEQQVLCLKAGLNERQERMLLAKEIGFQCLQEEERPCETRMLEVDSFEKLLANFHASYFAVALLLPEQVMLDQINAMRQWTSWRGEELLVFLKEMNVSPEMLVQRMANIFPKHFGINQLFFMRFFMRGAKNKFIVTKEMHLSQLHDPHANQLDEHYCRRWISIAIIRKLKAEQALNLQQDTVIAAQLSRYYNTPNTYFCISLAKPTSDNADDSTSVSIGLMLNDELKNLFPFLKNTNVPLKDVHTTCERCPISDCAARAVAPVFLQRQKRKDAIKKQLHEMKQSLNLRGVM